VEALAQLLIGILFIAIFVNYMKNGPAGVAAWWQAKFKGQAA
jgi:hypothetical protein